MTVKPRHENVYESVRRDYTSNIVLCNDDTHRYYVVPKRTIVRNVPSRDMFASRDNVVSARVEQNTRIVHVVRVTTDTFTRDKPKVTREIVTSTRDMEYAKRVQRVLIARDSDKRLRYGLTVEYVIE